VNRAVDFYGEPPHGAVEIEDKRPDGMLAAELEASK
jgi:hypothetical protein